MEMSCESNCLVCYKNISEIDSPAYETTPPTKFHEILDTFLKSFELILPKKYLSTWDFSICPLPFCVYCYDSILIVNELYGELKQIQNRLNDQLHCVETSIRNSRKKYENDKTLIKRKQNEQVDLLRDLIAGPFISLTQLENSTNHFKQVAEVEIKDDVNNSTTILDLVPDNNNEGGDNDDDYGASNDAGHQSDSDYVPEVFTSNFKKAKKSRKRKRKISLLSHEESNDEKEEICQDEIKERKKTLKKELYKKAKEQKKLEAIAKGENVRKEHNPCTPVIKISDTNFSYAGFEFMKMEIGEEQVFKCASCSVQVKTRGGMLVHIRLKHLGGINGVILCEICGSDFICETALKRHKEIHNEGRNYICEICQKGFKYPDALKVHVIHVHNKTKDKLCQFCASAFKMKSTLTAHILSVHLKERRHRCEVCDKMFFSISKLKRHMDSHSSERRYKCSQPDCQSAYKRKDRLRAHLKLVHGIVRGPSTSSNTTVNSTPNQ